MEKNTKEKSHHHHHHYREDDSAIFKQKSLNAIERRKRLKKITFIALVVIAILLGLAVILTTGK